MKVCSIFSQVLKLFSRGGFEKAVKQHKAERHARGFTSWGQFVAMLFCQVGGAHSLREICGGLACCEGQLKHLGVPADIEKLFPALGFIGVGEILPGGLVTTDIDPATISRDMGPIMEALQPKRLPILFPTGSTAFKGNLYYLYDVLWVDELAGNFPQVPIVLTKMGRGLTGCFDMSLVVAMRNANVFLDLTDSTGEHVRLAINKLGARRIMFGTDLIEISRNYAYDVGAEIVRDAKLSDEEWEWSAWRTANGVFGLGLEPIVTAPSPSGPDIAED